MWLQRHQVSEIITKECNNNGMSPDNRAQIRHALSFIVTSQYYLQCSSCQNCSDNPRVYLHVCDARVTCVICRWPDTWICVCSITPGLTLSSSLTLNIDSTLTPLTLTRVRRCRGLTLATRLHHPPAPRSPASEELLIPHPELGQDLSRSGETKS